MRMLLTLVLGVIVPLGLMASVSADDKDKKETTFDGTICCAKCELKKEKSCATVLVVKADGKESIIYFDKASNSKYHKEICTEAKKGKVTGKVTESDGKKWISVSKLEWEKD